MTRPVTRNADSSFMARRDFLRLGAAGGLVGALGCGAEGEGTVAVPKGKGNPSRLEKLEEKAAQAKSKAKKK